MKEITASGQTVEQAVRSALGQLNITKDQAEISIIDEGKKGLLGVFGSKPAIVKVAIRKDPIKETEKFIKEVINNMGVKIDLETIVQGKNVNFELKGEDIALLIGKRGQTLNALQYLVQLVLNRDSKDYYSATIDAEGYRVRRKETLESLAVRMANKAMKTKRKVVLEPMPAFERKIIHSTLQKIDGISTYSDGVEPHRHIVIMP